jgi:hypothetical protein
MAHCNDAIFPKDSFQSVFRFGSAESRLFSGTGFSLCSLRKSCGLLKNVVSYCFCAAGCPTLGF